MSTDQIWKNDNEINNYRAISKKVNELLKKVCKLSNSNGVGEIKVEYPSPTCENHDMHSNAKDVSEKLKLIEFIKKSEENKLNYLKSQLKLSEELIEKATEAGSKFVNSRDSIVSVKNPISLNYVSLDQLNKIERELEESLLGIAQKKKTMLASSSSLNGRLTSLSIGQNEERGHMDYGKSTRNVQTQFNAVKPEIQGHENVYSSPLLAELDPWLSPHSNSVRHEMMKALTPKQVAELFAGETGVSLGPSPTTTATQFLQQYMPAETSSQLPRLLPGTTNFNLSANHVPITKYQNVAENWSTPGNQNHSASGKFGASTNMGTFGINPQPIRKYKAQNNNSTLLTQPQQFKSFPTQYNTNLLGNSQQFPKYPQQNNISYGAQLQQLGQFGQYPNQQLGQYPAQTFSSNWNNNKQNGYGGNAINYMSNVPIGNNNNNQDQKPNNVQLFNSVTRLNSTNIIINEFPNGKRKRSNGIVISNGINENHGPTPNNAPTDQIVERNNLANPRSESLAWDGFALANDLNNMYFYPLI